MYVHPRFRWIADLYWCGIPLACRDCDYIRACRSGFFHGRKCLHGCLKAKRREAYLRDLDRKDYVDNLVKSFEEQE